MRIEYDTITQINIKSLHKFMGSTVLFTHDSTSMQEGFESQSENRSMS